MDTHARQQKNRKVSMSSHDLTRLLKLRVQRAIKGKRLNDNQLADLIASVLLDMVNQVPKVA